MMETEKTMYFQNLTIVIIIVQGLNRLKTNSVVAKSIKNDSSVAKLVTW